MDQVPLCVPVAIVTLSGERRCFRLATAVSESGLRLRTPLTEEFLRRPLRIRLTLPPPTAELARLFAEEWDGNLQLLARGAEEVLHPDTVREARLWRLLVFQKPDPEQLEKLSRYIGLRSDDA